MRIGLDLTLLRPDRQTGVERYAKNLALSLVQEAPQVEWVFFYRFAPPEELRCLQVETKIAPFKNRILVDQLWMPSVAQSARLDLLHAPAYPTPILYRGKTVLTVHDAAMWRYPAHVSKGSRWYYRPLFPRAIRQARKVITDSQFSLSELQSFFHLPASKIVSIPIGLAPALQGEYAWQESAEPFVLAVGTIEPRKNLPVLIEAMRLLPSRHQKVKLRIVGRMGWQDPQSLPSGPVEWLGALDDARLKAQYESASVFAFPSLYEGFGLPLLEAMASGTPALSSHAASLPEVGGDACLYADPLNPQEWADQLARLLDNPSLRHDLSKKSFACSQKFSWQKTAQATLQVYKQAMEESS